MFETRVPPRPISGGGQGRGSQGSARAACSCGVMSGRGCISALRLPGTEAEEGEPAAGSQRAQWAPVGAGGCRGETEARWGSCQEGRSSVKEQLLSYCDGHSLYGPRCVLPLACG